MAHLVGSGGEGLVEQGLLALGALEARLVPVQLLGGAEGVGQVGHVGHVGRDGRDEEGVGWYLIADVPGVEADDLAAAHTAVGEVCLGVRCAGGRWQVTGDR